MDEKGDAHFCGPSHFAYASSVIASAKGQTLLLSSCACLYEPPCNTYWDRSRSSYDMMEKVSEHSKALSGENGTASTQYPSAFP